MYLLMLLTAILVDKTTGATCFPKEGGHSSPYRVSQYFLKLLQQHEIPAVTKHALHLSLC